MYIPPIDDVNETQEPAVQSSKLKLPVFPTRRVFTLEASQKISSFTDSMNQISEEIEKRSKLFDELNKHADEVNFHVNCFISQLHEGIDHTQSFNELKIPIKEIVKLASADQLLNYQAQRAFEKFSGVCILSQFFKNGTVMRHRDITNEYIQPLSLGDEEYLSALFSFCQELENYSIKRATELDSASVKLCLELVSQLFEEFLKYDFRNGPLRRKYDAIKYVVKTLQNICYDLSIAAFRANKEVDEENGIEIENEKKESRFDTNELDEIRKRLDEYDAKREEVIKTVRDAQKASKQAIYSVHRNQQKTAQTQIDKASSVLESLIPTIEKEPSLRYGAYTNACEEYAEAVLFFTWLFKPEKPLLLRNQINVINHEEYLGGLVDFTGEVGRYAVVMATSRKKDIVVECLNVSVLIRQTVDSSKKLKLKPDKQTAIRTNCKKLQTLLYELTIAEYAGKASSVTIETDNIGQDRNGDQQ
jgi:predicted translin family RNA/ssDNA-binding protein